MPMRHQNVDAILILYIGMWCHNLMLFSDSSNNIILIFSWNLKSVTGMSLDDDVVFVYDNHCVSTGSRSYLILYHQSGVWYFFCKHFRNVFEKLRNIVDMCQYLLNLFLTLIVEGILDHFNIWCCILKDKTIYMIDAVNLVSETYFGLTALEIKHCLSYRGRLRWWIANYSLHWCFEYTNDPIFCL